jgi:hypothetical protein
MLGTAAAAAAAMMLAKPFKVTTSIANPQNAGCDTGPWPVCYLGPDDSCELLLRASCRCELGEVGLNLLQHF